MMMWYTKTLVDRDLIFQETSQWFWISSPFVLLTFRMTASSKNTTCVPVSWFFSTLSFFSPHRKTLQLNWTGATQSPLFPQADFPGNYFYFSFSQESAYKIQWIPFLFMFFMISGHFPKMQHFFFYHVKYLSAVLQASKHSYACTHTLACKNCMQCAHMHHCPHMHTWTQHCFLEVELLLQRVCLRGSCGVFRSGHTSHTGAGLGWPGGQSAIEGEG